MFYLEKETLQEICKKDEIEKSMMAVDGLLVAMNYIYGKVEEKEVEFKSDILSAHSEYLVFWEGESAFYVDADEFNSFCEHLKNVIEEEMKKLENFKTEKEIVQKFIQEFSGGEAE